MKPKPDGAVCRSCIAWIKNRRDDTPREWIQRTYRSRALSPLSRRSKRPRAICDDCAAAEVLMDIHGLSFGQARIAIGNARSEMLRLPGVRMGDPLGTMRLSYEGELEAHHAWLLEQGLDWPDRT